MKKSELRTIIREEISILQEKDLQAKFKAQQAKTKQHVDKQEQADILKKSQGMINQWIKKNGENVVNDVLPGAKKIGKSYLISDAELMHSIGWHSDSKFMKWLDEMDKKTDYRVSELLYNTLAKKYNLEW